MLTDTTFDVNSVFSNAKKQFFYCFIDKRCKESHILVTLVRLQ